MYICRYWWLDFISYCSHFNIHTHIHHFPCIGIWKFFLVYVWVVIFFFSLYKMKVCLTLCKLRSLYVCSNNHIQWTKNIFVCMCMYTQLYLFMCVSMHSNVYCWFWSWNNQNHRKKKKNQLKIKNVTKWNLILAVYGHLIYLSILLVLMVIC